jgi:hypothetical protein
MRNFLRDFREVEYSLHAKYVIPKSKASAFLNYIVVGAFVLSVEVQVGSDFFGKYNAFDKSIFFYFRTFHLV